ncbi:hypothetical protein ABH925_001099 [Streptacidiphilus sp. EB129]
MADTRAEAEGCVVVLRAMGMNVGNPTNLTHDGSWLVRARPADQRLQRQDGRECTQPHEAS